MKININNVKNFKKAEKTRGYTLGDFLITVSILTIIMGLCMLFVSKWATSLSMRELDRCAKDIYIEIQSQLATKETENGYEILYKDIQKSTSDRFLKNMPQDYDVTENGEGWQQLCYLYKEDSVIQNLLSESQTVKKIEGTYLVELNPSTGEVYGVFYWEKPKSIKYDIIEDLSDRSIGERKNLRIGYYHCGTQNQGKSSGKSIEQTAELINNEELYLKVTIKDAKKIIKNKEQLSIDITIADEHGHKWFVENANEKATKVTKENTLVFYFLLDSMQSGRSFHDITENRLVAGDDISIMVESEVSKGSSFSSQVSEVKGNSLFESVSNKAGTVIKVGNVRHFRNLSDRYYDYGKMPKEGTVKIIQTSNIDFENTNYAWQDGMYIGEGKGVKPLSVIEPIRNDSLFVEKGKDAELVEFDGNGFVLKNFKIHADADYAGMFAKAQNVRFRNVTIEDMTLSAEDRNNVGGLVGAITGGEIIDCNVYIKQYEENGMKKKYYVHQPANDTTAFSNRMQEKVATMRVLGGTNVGGLIGSADGTTITTCYAAVNVHGKENVGAFIGNASNVNVLSSSSIGDVYADRNKGSFIGFWQNVKNEKSNGYGRVK